MKNLVIGSDKRELSTGGVKLDDFEKPVLTYIMSLGSKGSRKSAISALNIVSRLFDENNEYVSFPWHDLKREHGLSIVRLLEQANLAPDSINAYMTHVKGVVKESWLRNMVDSDTKERFCSIKRQQGTRLLKGRNLDDSEKKALLAVCDNDESNIGLRDRAVISVMLGCGIRRAEAAGIKLVDVDISESSIRLIGKGDKERVTYMPNGALERVLDWLNVAGSGTYLFRQVLKNGRITERGISDSTIYKLLIKRRKQAAINDFSPHDLRRSFATKLLDNGVDVFTVRDAMGHSSVTTTQKYDKRDSMRVKEAIKNIDL